MADYISTLTGVQMDAALIDMAEHTSEAYAVGERNGVAVDSGDVAYHNNARYYAQQAQSIAPASVTEAVRWDVAQTALTDANRLQARENIKATSHNENLFDNGWFLVNSRGVANGVIVTGNAYFADRWMGVGTGGVTRNADGSITITATAYQKIGNIGISGKTVTFSALFVDGTIESGTVVFSGTPSITLQSINIVRFYESAGQINIGGASKNIRAVKLELGSFSTLAEDTPPDYGEELTRCIYSTADPSDTYANNGFGRSNPNLLDNPWWGKNETINQRGFTSVTPTTVGVYTIDRWSAFSGSGTVGGITNTVAGITINNNVTGANAYIYFRQSMPTTLDLTGKVITASVMLTNGVVYYASGVVPAKTTAYQSVATIPVPNITAGFSVVPTSVTTSNYIFQISVPSGRSIDIRAVKLELGSVSTLTNDTSPDYGTELLKCQRYFRRLKNAYSGLANILVGYCAATTACDFGNVLGGTGMRANPTLTYNGTFTVSGQAVTSFTVIGGADALITIRGNVASGLTTGACGQLTASSGAYIDLSADL